MLDPTLSESRYRKSVRAFFLHELETVRGKAVFFDRQYQIPKDDNGNELTNWIVIHILGPKLDTLSVGMLQVYCFSRKDEGNLLLTDLVDDMLDIMIDETKTDGCVRVPFYDYENNVIGAMVGTIDTNGSTQFGDDGTNYRMLTGILKWGAR